MSASVPPSPAPALTTATLSYAKIGTVTSGNDPTAPLIVVNPEDNGSDVVLTQNNDNEMPKFILSNANPEPAEQLDATERAIPSSQAHNVAQLIRDHMSSSKELTNNYLGAMKKKN